MDHVYTTSQSEVADFEEVEHDLDGIEGYIFPRNTPANHRPGAVRLMRKYNPQRDDHAIFPETMLSQIISAVDSMNDGLEWIGYVYLNEDSDGDGLIDVFERVLGTDIEEPDSDKDGIVDGTEVNRFPYSDPRLKPQATLIL